MTRDEITIELNRGGKFVYYSYCVSILLVTFMRSTNVHLVRANQSRFLRALPWLLLTLVVGWWGFPWGPVRAVQALWTDFQGGEDVTPQIAGALKLTGLNWDVVGPG